MPILHKAVSHQSLSEVDKSYFSENTRLLNAPKFNRAVEVRTSKVRIGTAGHSETIAF